MDTLLAWIFYGEQFYEIAIYWPSFPPCFYLLNLTILLGLIDTGLSPLFFDESTTKFLGMTNVGAPFAASSFFFYTTLNFRQFLLVAAGGTFSTFGVYEFD